MQNLIDLTQYGDNELSLMVFNDEELYRLRKSLKFETMLKEVFFFTSEQLEVLREDLADDG